MTETSVLQGQAALWKIEDPLPDELRAQLAGESVMLAHLLYCRGYHTPDEIASVLAGTLVSHDPFSLPDMTAAVDRLERAAAAGETVAVYGDFDCDGVTSAAVLQDVLIRLGLQPITVVPTRRDGHGLHPEIIAALADQGVTLVVTADCGVTAIEEVRVAQGMGMEVIVTDHHEPRSDGRLPACLVVAPTRHDATYPFRSLCGVGVAFKLAEALAARGLIPVPDDLLDLVALGTIADIVPLRDENRSLVLRGLHRLHCTVRPGLLALFAEAGVRAADIDPGSVAYYLAPRINAANRLASPQLAFDLLTTADPAVARDLAAQLSRYNVQRQRLVEEHLNTVTASLGAPADVAAAVQSGERPPLLAVIGSWPPGISGLLASKLVEIYGLPAFVGTGEEIVSVSGRGVPSSRIDDLLERCEAALPGGIFLGYGGHAGAGGFSVRRDQLEVALGLLDEAAAELPIATVGAVLTIDAEVRLGTLDLHAAQQVQRLAPFGVGFPEPLFLVRDVAVRGIKPLRGGHARLTLSQNGTTRDAVFFGADEAILSLRPNTVIDAVGHIQINEWNGRSKPELRVRDWRPVPVPRSRIGTSA
ncbi:MAG TPA: single-stranded-DNA-specific exonuclease RecJ [Chloroflexota bacterium]|nr:single-stranded-DNA-specific exonuclease RecJ [Chloroflexota bacterium]